MNAEPNIYDSYVNRDFYGDFGLNNIYPEIHNMFK